MRSAEYLQAFLTTYILLSAFLVLFCLETFFPLRPSDKYRARLARAAQNVTIFIGSFVTVPVLLAFVITPARGLFAPGTIVRTLDLPHGMSVIVDFIVGFVVLDCTHYFIHRSSHRIPWVWKLHLSHHYDDELDAGIGLRVHPLHAVYQAVLSLLPIWALGIEPSVAIAYNLIAYLHALIVHANIRLFPEADYFLRSVFDTPLTHQIHHSRDRIESESNFGVVFSIWDRLFGTYRCPKPESKIRFGLDGYSASKWQSLRGILSSPFS